MNLAKSGSWYKGPVEDPIADRPVAESKGPSQLPLLLPQHNDRGGASMVWIALPPHDHKGDTLMAKQHSKVDPIPVML